MRLRIEQQEGNGVFSETNPPAQVGLLAFLKPNPRFDSDYKIGESAIEVRARLSDYVPSSRFRHMNTLHNKQLLRLQRHWSGTHRRQLIRFCGGLRFSI